MKIVGHCSARTQIRETQKLNRVKRVSGIYCLLRTYESIARHVIPRKNEFLFGNRGK